jgi:hypothetical protein
MNLSDLRFPVLVINGFGLPCSYSSPTKLLRCPSSALRRGKYTGLRIFDAAGNGLELRGAQGVRTVGGWGWLLLNPTIEVTLDVEKELHGLTLDDIKRALCDMVDRDQTDLWEPHEAEKARIRRIRTMEEVVSRYLGVEEYL